jgi:hypothetical protein
MVITKMQWKKMNPDIPNKITTYETTNKSDRDVDMQFDQTEFNKQFESNEQVIKHQTKLLESDDLSYSDEINGNLLPHQRPVQDIIIIIREMFYNCLEMLIDKKNPIPYVIATPDRQFALAILLIVLGSLFLLFGNLMISSEKNN